MVRVGVYRTFYDVIEIPNKLAASVPKDEGAALPLVDCHLNQKNAWPSPLDMQELPATFIRLD